MAASVASEFYKLREEWRRNDAAQHWRLAVWVAQYTDIDIIDKFMEIEQSPVGIFDDIFFKFDTIFDGDKEAFSQKLWDEYISWFDECPKPELDMYAALKEAGYFTTPYKPDSSLKRDISNLWKELLRFRDSIKDFNAHFCIYFPLVAYSEHNLSGWLTDVVPELPQGLRLVTLDLAEDRRLSLNKVSAHCVWLRPQLNMLEAINNEMDKDSGNYNTVDVHARFRKQIRVVMESTTAKVNNQTEKEVKKLFRISEEMNTFSGEITALFVAAQALFTRDGKQSNYYVDKALEKAVVAMERNDKGGYEIWKSCMLMKAAIKFTKEKQEALSVYEALAGKAADHGDAYTVMEARRMSGHLYYELGDMNTAFEYMLMALAAGSFLQLEVRRHSTFLHAAHMALFTGVTVRKQADIQELKYQLAEWLGEGWEALLQQEGIAQSELKQKTKFF